MKFKVLTLIIGFAVLIAVLISCVTIPLPNENSNNDSQINSKAPVVSTISDNSENSSTEVSSDNSKNESPDNSTLESSTDQSNPSVVTEQSTDWSRYTAKECDEYFKESVFVGDSVMLGYKSYIDRKRLTNSEFMSSVKFHVAGSYGAESALWPISDKSVHPMYQGEQTKIEDAVALMGVKKVFILFGLNDVGKYNNGTGPEETLKNYKTLFSRIKEKSPDVEIIIISATYLYEDWEKSLTNLTSKNLRKLNQLMLEYCNENSMDYIDVATALATDNGYLKPDYCSDNECHLYDPAYDIWTNIFRAYAASKLDSNYKNVSSMTMQFE
ncbi:MAG: hypothetical protein A2Y17_02890 [Clostridiales bacterium GWF2_38_85]|nr:MAG: hypothetical protein A2Y17_02890 [Clostridiales bacterium GWF2_38_85]